MCGITGIYAFNDIGWFHSINLPKSNLAISHRGPDAGKIWTENRCGLGHRRLSILDLSSAANQPMTDPSGRYTIIFNGEIYNFQHLRKPLQDKGIQFNTSGDTEVLLQLLIHEGVSCLPKLHGFWAFAFYDKQEDELLIARDRFGIKPLVWYMDEDKFLFGSEMSAILAFGVPREIDYVSLFLYFQLCYVPEPHCIFKNMQKLPAAHYLKLKGRNLEIKRYYQTPCLAPSQFLKLSYEDAQKELLQRIEDSVQERMIADVPLGAFLSGGIDSSTVVAFASRFTNQLNTFSIGYKDEPLFDETKYANLVAKKYQTNHTVFTLTNDDLFEAIQELLNFYGEPFADSSAIPVYVLCKNTRKKVTVALSGDGGDEVFAGYNKHLGEWKARQRGWDTQLVKMMMPLLAKMPKNRNSFLGNKARQLYRFGSMMDLSPQERYWALCTWKKAEDVKSMLNLEVLSKVEEAELNKRIQGITQHIQGDDFNEILYADLQTLLPSDMLHKVDSMSMANALEVRVPLLDYRIVDFAFSLPSEYKINGKMKKRLLQDAVRPLLPAELYNRPKHGFDVPLAKGFRQELRGWVEELLKDDFIAEQGIFEVGYIRNLKNTVFNTQNFDQNQVWAILAFQYWWRKVTPVVKQEV
ncbi:MAG: asparagine synthase (glutamine-hydrolyzing) [Flammeovirgaceae bacterium]